MTFSHIPKRNALLVYLALQRYRIGPNFRFVDVNWPRCPLHNNAQDGPLNIANQTGEINYFPSEFSNQVSLHAARGHCMQRSQDVQGVLQLYRHQQYALSAGDVVRARCIAAAVHSCAVRPGALQAPEGTRFASALLSHAIMLFV